MLLGGQRGEAGWWGPAPVQLCEVEYSWWSDGLGVTGNGVRHSRSFGWSAGLCPEQQREPAALPLLINFGSVVLMSPLCSGRGSVTAPFHAIH